LRWCATRKNQQLKEKNKNKRIDPDERATRGSGPSLNTAILMPLSYTPLGAAIKNWSRYLLILIVALCWCHIVYCHADNGLPDRGETALKKKVHRGLKIVTVQMR